ncbi:MAG: glycoside hydrolase family 44 protein [Candidatus Sulfotelmatobacter sp.]
MSTRPKIDFVALFVLLVIAAALFLQACGGSGSSGGGGGGGSAPAVPTGLTATPGNMQVSLSWSASSGATSYNVGTATVSGGPYSTVSTSATNYTVMNLTNGTTYYFVVAAANSVGTSANSSQMSATPNAIPAAPVGLTATPGNMQVSLSWSASSSATSYNVERGTASGGPYTTVNSPTTTSYVDTGLTNGTTYYYVVTAVNSVGQSAPSSQATATPAGPATQVAVTVNVLANRHPISAYVYGGSFPQDAATITDSGLTVVRWGGNAASTYNNQLGTYNADNDYYFEDFTFNGFSSLSTESGVSSSTSWITDVQGAGSNPLMTMVMMQWVAQSPEIASPPNGHWSFSVAKYGAQCSTDFYNSDAGDGLKTDCATELTANPNDAYFPLLDDSSQACSGGNCVYREPWATALAAAFNGGNTPHFYNMDNEIDIWGGTHFDIHPQQSGYSELANTYLLEANNLKIWDPAAIRLGPVSCCWYFYWQLNSTTDDKATHAGIDFLPWWLNQIAWSDAVSGTRSLDVFDIHAYPDGPSTSGLTQAQLQALAVRVYRDYWDPTYTSEATYIQNDGFSIEPLEPIPFRIPRMRAIVNSIYPGTQFSITEWSAAFAGESDFSTAIGDADAYGILGRERVYLASRWTAPSPTNPNYEALKLFTNYDGAHHGFGTTSILDANNGNPSLFSSYAALNAAGNAMTLLVLNKDPQNSASVTFTLTGFTPSSVVSYTLAPSSPTTITASSSSAWSSTMTFAPYTATLLLINGSVATSPASEWDLNPDTTMVAAGGTVTLQPEITSGTANVTLQSAVFDSFEGASACTGGTITLTDATISPSQPGTITVTAGNTVGFCHFTVTGTDGSATQTKGGWIVVGNPAATFTQTGSGQSGAAGTALANPLTVTLLPGSSGGTNTGASVLFSTSAGTLSNGTTSGPKVIAITNSSGVASVTLTLPSTAGPVTVTAEGPYGLGHPVATFAETSQ